MSPELSLKPYLGAVATSANRQKIALSFVYETAHFHAQLHMSS